MSNRTRYFLVGTGLVLMVGLGTGLVAYYSGGLSRSMRHESAELAYVPADASIVAYADVRAVMASEFRQRLRQLIPDGSAQKSFQDETGIDIERDIDSVVAVLGPGPDVKNGRELFLIRGEMNAASVENYLTQHGGIVEDYRGKRVIKNSNGDGCVAFLEPGLVAIGGLDSVKHAIDGGQGVASNADMMRLINEVATQGATGWAVGRLDKVTDSAGVPAQVKDQLSAVQWFAVTGRVDGGVSGTVHLEARDDQAGDQLRAVVNGALALAHLQMGKDAKLDGVINSLQLSGTGKDVQLAFSVPADVLDVVNGIAGLANLHSGKPPIKQPGT